MADLSKADKIAAGYKKLKEFQKKSGKTETKAKKHSLTDNHKNNTDIKNQDTDNSFADNEVNCVISFPDSDAVDNSLSQSQVFQENLDDNADFFQYDKFECNENISSKTEFPSIQSYFSNNSNDFDQIIQPTTVEVCSDVPLLDQSIENDQPTFRNNDQNLLELQQINFNPEKSETIENMPVPVFPSFTELPKPFESIESVHSVIDENIEPINSTSIENIRQMSSEMKKLIDFNETSPTCIQSTQSELEYRNLELVGMLENRNMEVAQLTSRLQEYFNRIQELETQLRQTQSDMTSKVQQELHPLKEQLDYHAQTIGVLVAEKSELSAALEKNQAIIKGKISENEELQCKLRASRHRKNDLETEVANLKSALESRIQLQSHENVDAIKSDLIESKKRIEELLEEISELSQNLNSKSQECLSFKEELVEKTNQLSLLELKLHQVCNNETSQLEFQVEGLTKEKLAMELKINHLAEELKSLSLEKDKTNEQYQQYVTQLNEQIKSFSAHNENLTKENQKFLKRESELITHIGNLEKEIQVLHNHKNVVPQKDTKEIGEFEEKISSMSKLIEDKNKEISLITEEKKDLLKELETRNYQIVSLEEKLKELETDRPNVARLAAIMESDQVAAAQAIKQNSKLTKQVEELQDKFVEMTQRELTLTEKLGTEQHLGQEILKQLKSREAEVEILKQQLADKDSKKMDLQKSCSLINDSTENTSVITESVEHSKPDNNMHESSLENSVDITSALNNQQKPCVKCQENEEKMNKMEAVHKLEERFKKTMEDVARLTDEKLELEHLVMQLQSETETIGEYVALYQFQRGILKQRSEEKDQELRLLNQDREQMKQKLAELNNLIRQFVSNKNTEAVVTEEYEKLNVQTNDAQHFEQNLNGDPNVQVQRADKIIELISEINSSNLIEPKDNVYHVCSLCSGQLITV